MEANNRGWSMESNLEVRMPVVSESVYGFL